MNLDKTLKRRELKKEADKKKKVCKNCKHYRKRSQVTGECYMHYIYIGWIRSEMANCYCFKIKEKNW